MKSKASTPDSQEDTPVRLTVEIPRLIHDEAVKTLEGLSGTPYGMTMDALVDTALRREIIRLRGLHNNGKPFS